MAPLIPVSPSPTTSQNARLVSLDAFRGFTIAAMLLVNNPGDWGHLHAPLAHAHWHGWTFTDSIFPAFVFISGMAMTLSLGLRAQRGNDRSKLLALAARRALTIIAMGVLLNLIPGLSWSELRIPGVLQRLGLCTLLAAPLVLYLDWRQQALCLLALLVAYSMIILGVPVPDVQGVWHQGALTPGADVGAWLDRSLMQGHLWQQSTTWDPEGLLSTLPALASQLAGVLAGHWLATQRPPIYKAVALSLVGGACMALGEGLGSWLMPINKSLWTPSYVVFMAGWSLLVFAVFFGLLDALKSPWWRAWFAALTRPLVMFGMNALFLYVLAELLAKMLAHTTLASGQSLHAALYAPIQSLGLAPANASLLFAVGFVALMCLVAWGLWRKQIFIKV